MIVLKYAAVLSATVQSAHAWGVLGHAAVAYIAQDFVLPNTECWARSILSNTRSPDYLAKNASWPDDFDHHGGKWSGNLHFIDAHDCPPNVECTNNRPGCNVYYELDCKDKFCVISAIRNYTERVKNPKLEKEQMQEALLFLVHFLGDVTQPLHNENIARGGNDIWVTFNQESVKLHATWDSFIPEKMNGQPKIPLPAARAWAQALTDAIKKPNGIYHLLSAGWIEGDDISTPINSSMRWSREANALVCAVVMPEGPDALQEGDLFPVYFNSATDTVNLQIARAGYRLANWLNMLATPDSCPKKAIYANAPFSQKLMDFHEEEL